jgi:hypothetical protein
VKRKKKPLTSFVILTRRAVSEADMPQFIALLREEATWHDEDSAMQALLLRAATLLELQQLKRSDQE